MPNMNEFAYLLGAETTLKALCEGVVKHLSAMPIDVQKKLADQMKSAMKAEQKRLNGSNKPKNTIKGKEKKFTRLSDFGPELQGLPSNRYGGCQLQSMRGLRGGSYGPVNKKHRTKSRY